MVGNNMELSITKTLYLDIVETNIINKKWIYDVHCKINFYTDIDMNNLDHSEEKKFEWLTRDDISFDNIILKVQEQLTN